MNPTVLIATHERLEITSKNIESLLKQSVKPQIVLVVTDLDEIKYYQNKFEGIQIINEFNNPLGDKWQTGVDFSRSINPDPLIILGSDDILGDGYIEKVCELIAKGNDFVGIRRWWQHHEGKAYHCDYLAKHSFPLGGGRCYSGKMLKRIDYKLFERQRNRHLDDYGWDNARNSGLKCLVIDNPEQYGLSIHAIKGDWPVMNPFTISHKNIRLLRSQKSIEVLPSFYGHTSEATL